MRDLATIEAGVLRRWAAEDVPARALARTAAGPLWVCHDSPAAAHGMPGLHHLPGMAVRDLYQRYKTMQGFRVPRRVGWDCHGLPVEVAVERELALSGKGDIERYGVGRFSDRCREFALRHAGAFSALITRMGYWADLDQAYLTMDTGYVESVWWSLRQLVDAGLLARVRRPIAYCPRCQTPLSEYDLRAPGAYRKVTSTAVTVRFRLCTVPEGLTPWLPGADLLVRTSRPWTLVPAAAVAVHPHLTYAVARRPGTDDRVVVAESLAGRVLGEGWHITARVTGADLAGATCQSAFGLGGAPGPLPVIPGYFVPADGGTGLVLVVPAFGSEELQASREHGLEATDPIGPDGCFGQDLPLVGGVFFTTAEPILIDALADRDLLFAAHPQERSRPHCWRCGTPLLRRVMSAWYVRTTAVDDRLLAGHEPAIWPPASSSDWAISRSRYWGTPLPLWECQDGHQTWVTSLAELSELAGLNLIDLDPHRPDVDLVTITCPQCGAAGRRVADVVDPGYDAAAMPFAHHGGPPAGRASPHSYQRAQLVIESQQAPRGWSDALKTVGTLAFGHGPFDNALRLGPVLDEDGRPMTGSLGNLAEPIPLVERYGSDAMRWFLVAAAPPEAARKVSGTALAEIVRKILLTYLNTASFLVIHLNAAAARGEPWRPDHPGTPPPAARPLLDRWILGELDDMVSEVTAALESFKPDAAGRRIARFVDDLSNWYLRRSRRRFRHGPRTPDGAAAFATLHASLDVLTRVLAPITPFLSDHVWKLLADATCSADLPGSVHLTSWPAPAGQLADEQLASQMALARRIAELGRSARATASIRVRQPLARALVAAKGLADLCGEFRSLAADELNVRTLELLEAADDGPSELTVKPNFRALGPRFGRDSAAVAAAIKGAAPEVVAASLRSTGTFPVHVAGAEVVLTAQEVLVTRTPLPGWSVVTDGGQTVALDLEITPELRREGMAREVIRLIQDARKADGLYLGDQVEVLWSTGSHDLAIALAEHGPAIGADVRAAAFGPRNAVSAPDPGAREHVCAGLGLAFSIRPVRRTAASQPITQRER